MNYIFIITDNFGFSFVGYNTDKLIEDYCMCFCDMFESEDFNTINYD